MVLSLTKRICDLLIKKKLVSEDDLKKARKIAIEEGKSLSDCLYQIKAISKEALLDVLSEAFGFAPIRLSNFKIEKDVLHLIPEKIIRSYQMLPISRISNQLTVAMVDPLNILALDDLKVITHMNIIPVIVDEDDMKEALRKYYERSADEEINTIVAGIKHAEMKTLTEKEEEVFSSGELLRIQEEAPLVKLADMILSRAVKERASDILIEPLEDTIRVRYRIDGILCERFTPLKKFHQALVSRIKVMSNLDIAERRIPQDGRFRIKSENRKIDFRVSIVPSSFGEKVALRVLDKQQAMIDIDSLGFREHDKEKIKAAGMRPHGMILVCGPTGCGKTTTLYAILKYVDSPEKNIITAEDPVEYELKGINQVSINEEIELTFARCLRSVLRQDPDVIMVGEIRDLETLDIAIKSALTGHLVLSTLHTNTASGSVVRMINMGVEPFLIAASLELVAAQRLVRRLCPECKEAYEVSKEIIEKYSLFDKSGKAVQIYRPKGCKRCLNTGYKGRIGIIECMSLSKNIKELIFKRAGASEIEKVARQEGMVTLRENGMQNVIDGITSLEDVLRVTVGDTRIG